MTLDFVSCQVHRALVPNCYTKNKFALNMVDCFLSLVCTWAALWTTSTEEMILVPDTDADAMDRISDLYLKHRWSL